jgi:hypothetical protein
MYGVMRRETPAVAVDGQVHSRLNSIGTGDLRHPGLNHRYAECSRKIVAMEIFHRKQGKHSSSAGWRERRYLADCAVCPASSGHIPAPHQISGSCPTPSRRPEDLGLHVRSPGTMARGGIRVGC